MESGEGGAVLITPLPTLPKERAKYSNMMRRYIQSLSLFPLVLIGLFLSSCFYREIPVDKDGLLGNDYRLFQDGPSWDLAKAVQDQDVDRINHLIAGDRQLVNYQEPQFGSTLLMLAVMNGQFKSCEALVKSGFDPNLHDTYDGTSAIIYAAGGLWEGGKNPKILALLLQHKGNPNDEETGPRREGNQTRKTALSEAASCLKDKNDDLALIKVKMLVEAGANINYVNDRGSFALREALFQENLNVVNYLLRAGADYTLLLVDNSLYQKNGQKVYIQQFLRSLYYPLDSKEYRKKMEIVNFLQSHHIDYWAVPIPPYITKDAQQDYPHDWEGYLRKY